MKLLYFVNLVTINLHKSIRHIGGKIKSGNPDLVLFILHAYCTSRSKKTRMITGFSNCAEYIFINIIAEAGLKRSYLARRKKTNSYRESSDTK